MDRMTRAEAFADNIRDAAQSPEVRNMGEDIHNYLAGVEDALRWVLGVVPDNTITEALSRCGVPDAHKLLP